MLLCTENSVCVLLIARNGARVLYMCLRVVTYIWHIEWNPENYRMWQTGNHAFLTGFQAVRSAVQCMAVRKQRTCDSQPMEDPIRFKDCALRAISGL